MIEGHPSSLDSKLEGHPYHPWKGHPLFLRGSHFIFIASFTNLNTGPSSKKKQDIYGYAFNLFFWVKSPSPKPVKINQKSFGTEIYGPTFNLYNWVKWCFV